MKIQKGVLKEPSSERASSTAQPSRPPSESDQMVPPTLVEKNRLFETLDKEEKSNRNYAKLLVVAIVAVVILGGVIFYLTLPTPGDLVRAPKGAEDAVRSELLEKQKREAEDIVFYYCGDRSYWARADVKTRTDMPNPVFRIGKYAATVTGEDPNWNVSSKPIVSPADDVPCGRSAAAQ